MCHSSKSSCRNIVQVRVFGVVHTCSGHSGAVHRPCGCKQEMTPVLYRTFYFSSAVHSGVSHLQCSIHMCRIRGVEWNIYWMTPLLNVHVGKSVSTFNNMTRVV